MVLLRSWKLDTAFLGLSSVVITALVAVSVKDPRLVFVGAVGLGFAALVVYWPPLSVILILAVDGLALVLYLLDLDGGIAGYGSYGLLVVAAITTLLRSRGRARYASIAVLAVLVFLVLYGVLAAAGEIGSGQIVGGVRLVSTPILCGLVGLSMNAKDSVRLLRFGTFIVVSSFFAAMAEKSLGAASLIALGLEAGTTVRTYEGVLRAPGLFATNYSMGAFAGVIGALALLWWPTLESSRRSKIWRAFTVAASVGCLYLSIYRTGILVMAVAIVAWIIFGRGRNSSFQKVAIVGSATMGVLYFFRSGFGSSSSFFERLGVWENILSSSPPNLIGYGIGFSGAASGSRFASAQITVDNYFLSLVLQFGAAAILLVLPLVTLAAWMTVRSSAVPMLRSGMVLLGCLVAFMFVDYWEYVAAMSCTVCAVGIGYGAYVKNVQRELKLGKIDNLSATPVESPRVHGRQ